MKLTIGIPYYFTINQITLIYTMHMIMTVTNVNVNLNGNQQNCTQDKYTKIKIVLYYLNSYAFKYINIS